MVSGFIQLIQEVSCTQEHQDSLPNIVFSVVSVFTFRSFIVLGIEFFYCGMNLGSKLFLFFHVDKQLLSNIYGNVHSFPTDLKYCLCSILGSIHCFINVFNNPCTILILFSYLNPDQLPYLKAQREMKMWRPCSKTMKNFTTLRAEHQTKHRAPPRTNHTPLMLAFATTEFVSLFLLGNCAIRVSFFFQITANSFSFYRNPLNITCEDFIPKISLSLGLCFSR